MRVTAADLDERRVLGDLPRGWKRLYPAAAGGGRGRLTTPARTSKVGGPATTRATLQARKSAEGVSVPVRRAKRPARGQDGALRRLQRVTAPRERDIQRDILAFLNAQPGVYAWKAGAGLIPTADGRRVRMGKAGTADVIGWVRMCASVSDGRRRCASRACEAGHWPVWVAIEVKRPQGGKRPTPAQLDFLSRLRAAGSPLAMVATSVDQVRRVVEALC